QGDDVLCDHLLLASKSAADAFSEDADSVRWKIKECAECVARKKRRLRTRADVQLAVTVQPANRPMSLEVRVLNPLTHIHALVDDVGFGEAFLDVADVAVQLSN